MKVSLATAAALALCGVMLSGCLAYDVASTAVSAGTTVVGVGVDVVGAAGDVVTAPFDRDDDKKPREH